MGTPEAVAPLVELRGLGKRFGGVQALRDVDLRVVAGEIHGLVGENGAGKSTLGKIIAGVHRPDEGRLLVDGRPVQYRTPHDALQDGLTIIAQELALVPQLSVLQNVFLGVEEHRAGVVRRRALRERYRELAPVGFDLDPDVPVGALSTAERQKVEILRAIARRARLIVMDEPTASLTSVETAKLLDAAQRLSAQGTAIVFVSHMLEDVLRICDTVTILRDGRVVATRPAPEESPASLVRGMVGTDLDLVFPDQRPPPADADVVLRVEGLTVPGKITDVSLEVRRGEIVGLAGLIGSGRSETARAIFGAERLERGQVMLGGRRLRLRGPRDAIRAGIALLPESRKEAGLVMSRSIVDNVSLPHLHDISTFSVVDRPRELSRTREVTEQVAVKAPHLRASVATLSGGNQQKTLFAKWLYRRPSLLIADEPTRGVDVGAKRAIYEILTALASQGMAILLISSELEELLGLAHRILVMRGGSIVGELTGGEATSETVLQRAFGTGQRQFEDLVG